MIETQQMLALFSGTPVLTRHLEIPFSLNNDTVLESGAVTCWFHLNIGRCRNAPLLGIDLLALAP